MWLAAHHPPLCGGLFGGDPSWGIGTYVPVSASYRNSASYRSTVATADGTYQRAPVSCWYAMGEATVNSIRPNADGSTTLRMAWNPIRVR